MQKYHDEPKQYKGYLKSALVEFDQRFIQMQILDHRTHLEVEPLSTHLVRPVLWPLLLWAVRAAGPYRVTAHPVSERPNDSPVGDDRQIKTRTRGQST